jgi:CHAD domain-containing protein
MVWPAWRVYDRRHAAGVLRREIARASSLVESPRASSTIEWTLRGLLMEQLETELKLASGARTFRLILETLRARHGARLSAPRRAQLRDSYFDSADWWLHRAGGALRLRGGRGERELTLKSLRLGAQDFARRVEWSERLPAAGRAAAHLPAGGRLLRLIRRSGGPSALHPIFQVRSVRTTVDARIAGGIRLQASLDHAMVFLRGRRRIEDARFDEVEVERIAGPRAPSEAILRRLAGRTRLPASRVSKYDRALAVLGLGPSGPPDRPTVQPHDRLIDTAYRILAFHFDQMRHDEPGARLGLDPEYVHHMRVAIRELRTAIRVFGGVLPKSAAVFAGELGWVGRKLGAVRDLDVQWRLAPQLPTSYERPLRAQWQAARRRLLAALDSARYARLIRQFDLLLDAGPTGDLRRAAYRPAARAARRLIRNEYRRTLRRGRHALRDPSEERLHRVRIACKRLRYTAEWCRGLYGRSFVRMIERLARLQELLGRHQDAVNALARLKQEAGRPRGARTLAAEYRLARQEAAKKFPKAWRRFARAPLKLE